MMSAEKFRAPEPGEAEHFDDFEAMDIALRGLERVLADKPKPDTVSGSNEDDGSEKENKGEDNGEDDDCEDSDNYNDYWEDDDYYEEIDEGEERTEELEREKQFEVLTIPKELLKEYDLPQDLPMGVAVMGGTARSIARRLVAGDKEPVRDLDLVYITEFEEPENPIDREELDEIAEKYMPDDFAYGHGIRRENLEDYFGSRDFTMNQCLVVGNKLLMTRAAYDDLQENIIRTTYYEQPKEYSPVRDRIFMKALLMQAALRGNTSSYPMIEDLFNGRYDENDNLYEVGPFDIALVLNKAMSRGVRTARYLTEGLAEFDVVDEKYIDQPLLLGRAITDSRETGFLFRPVDTEIEDGDDEDGDFEARATSPMEGVVRKALREYESKGYERWTEPLSGKYTKADYDKVNGVA